MYNKVFAYSSPTVQVIVFLPKDVITLSAGTNNGADGNQGDGNWWDEGGV